MNANKQVAALPNSLQIMNPKNLFNNRSMPTNPVLILKSSLIESKNNDHSFENPNTAQQYISIAKTTPKSPAKNNKA